jgi:hypothetical protein
MLLISWLLIPEPQQEHFLSLLSILAQRSQRRLDFNTSWRYALLHRLCYSIVECREGNHALSSLFVFPYSFYRAPPRVCLFSRYPWIYLSRPVFHNLLSLLHHKVLIHQITTSMIMHPSPDITASLEKITATRR